MSLNSSLTIIEQTEHIIVVIKPAGMLSVPARTSNDPRPVLGKILEQELKRQIYPVHRLDEEVSGIMLYALSASAHKFFSQCFENHLIEKTYLALSSGHHQLNQPEEWQSLLMRGKKRAYEAPFGKKSITFARCLKNLSYQNQPTSLWKLFPKTGRGHQLRFELFKHQHPIIGDSLYGSTLSWEIPNAIALVSTEILLPASCTQAPWNLSNTYRYLEHPFKSFGA